MPALLPVSKVLRIDFIQSLGGNTNVRDRIFLQYSGAASATDVQTVLGTISTSWNTNISPLQEAAASLNQLQATDLTSATATQVLVSASHAGTGTGQMWGNGTACVIKFKIARRYRGGHPRFYLGGLAASIVTTGNIITSANVTTINSAFNTFMSSNLASPPAGIGTLTHVNVHYFSGFTVVTNPITHRARNVPTPINPPTVDTISAYVVNPKIASQRRRNQQSA